MKYKTKEDQFWFKSADPTILKRLSEETEPPDGTILITICVDTDQVSNRPIHVRLPAGITMFGVLKMLAKAAYSAGREDTRADVRRMLGIK